MTLIPDHKNRAIASGEDGYILIGVLILLALFIIALAVAAPRVGKQIERDKEVEAVQRGKQYTRAIKLYYKRFGNYPGTIAMLESTNNVRYLRKRYKDPITGKDDWRIIHAGEAKVPVMGFFGQPLQAGLSSVTTGPNGAGGIGSSGGISNSGGGPSFGGVPSSASNGISSNPSTTGGSSDGSVTAGGGSGAPAGLMPGMSGGGGQAGGIGSPNGGDSANAGGSGSGLGSTSGSGFGSSTTGGSSTGGGFDGGGRIVGVGLPVNKKSIVVYHKQDAFNKWEFTYDPIQDQQTISSGGGIPGTNPIGNGNPLGAPSTTGGSQNNPFSNNNNNNGPGGGTIQSSPGGIQDGGATPPTSGTPPN